MTNSSKPKETAKKISNKRVKRNHSEIDTETPTKTNLVSDDRNKEDSESSISTQNVSTERNHHHQRLPPLSGHRPRTRDFHAFLSWAILPSSLHPYPRCFMSLNTSFPGFLRPSSLIPLL